jgi:hypothetical protein
MEASNQLGALPALLSGEARRISAAEKAQMELDARPAVLKATIHITRAATGKVETYELTGEPPKEQ